MSGPNGQPIRILIAEDHAIVRQSVKIMLEMEPEFIVVGEAEDGQQALDLAEKVDPDLVLMDIRMEGMDGVEAPLVQDPAGEHELNRQRPTILNDVTEEPSCLHGQAVAVDVDAADGLPSCLVILARRANDRNEVSSFL